MEDRTVIQWDKDDLDALGLLKVDCLALGMLSAIRRALDMISQLPRRAHAHAGHPGRGSRRSTRCASAPTRSACSRSSRARSSRCCRGCKPACFYDLVIEVAIVRPGPIQGGMVHPYLRAAAGPRARHVSERRGEERARAHARRADLPGAGDAARDRRRGLHAGRGRPAAPLDGGVAAQGRPREVRAAPDRRHGARAAMPKRSRGRSTSRSWASASTAFPESHSASFALLVYVSCVAQALRAGGVHRARCSTRSRWASTRRRSSCGDARRHGVEVRPADVTVSDWDCTLEPQSPEADAETCGLPRAAPRPAHDRRTHGSRRATHRRRARDARRSRTSPISRTARSSTAATSPRSPTPTRSPRSPAIATTRCGTSPASSSCRALLAGATFAEADPGLPPPTEGQDIVADYRAPRPHAAAAIRSRCCAASLRSEAARHRRRHRAHAARPHRAHRRHRHRPAAAGHRERRHLRHARGRDRRAPT